MAYSVAPNALATPRNGAMTVAGRTVSIDQAGVSCGYTVTPTSLTLPGSASANSLEVTAPAGCAWSAASDSPSWLQVTAGTPGNGHGYLSFAAAANPLVTPRTARLTVAGQMVTVT
ncbi:MAG: BACON domain-containing protein [Acidimicrobiia bacterium]|nr:BACON domain-containing protein [Acidimicrobiia bacterium]